MNRINEKILAWYARQGRNHLPWRQTRDAYAIYISEIMLQQTQVKTVLERFYAPFLKAFPTLQSLADAPLESVLKQWEGLGYYSRARNLHKAAQLSAPSLPETVEGLLALPGIGRNTAHAVASFAYGIPVPVMEANVKRVLARLHGWHAPTEAELWSAAQELMGDADPFDHNQAMMDIGSLICTPKRPLCSLCPLADICIGKQQPEAYPAPKQAKKVPVRQRYITLIKNTKDEFWLSPRQTRFLGGLYGFMETEIPVTQAKTLGHITHTYSHFRLEAEVMALDAADAPYVPEGEWLNAEAISEKPLSRADQKAWQLAKALEVV